MTTMQRESRTALSRCGALALLAGALSIAGCGEAPADQPTGTTDSLSFDSPDDALAWLAAYAPVYPGAHVVRDRAGVVQTINFDDDAARDALVGELRRFKTVRVAGVSYATADLTFAAEPTDATDVDGNIRVGAVTSGIPDSRVRCEGSFCIASFAIYRQWSIFGIGYHEVGGRTDITSGGAKTFVCPPNPSGIPSVTPNYCPTGYTPKLDADYVFTCRQKDPVRNPHGYSCVKVSGTQGNGVAVTYMTNTDNCGGGHCVSTPTAVRTDQLFSSTQSSIKLSQTAFGRLILPCNRGFGPGECYIDGVCVTSSATANGFGAQASSASGSYDCPQ